MDKKLSNGCNEYGGGVRWMWSITFMLILMSRERMGGKKFEVRFNDFDSRGASAKRRKLNSLLILYLTYKLNFFSQFKNLVRIIHA